MINFLKNEAKRNSYIERWLKNIPENVKLSIRESVYRCLDDPDEIVRKVSAQVFELLFETKFFRYSVKLVLLIFLIIGRI